MSPGVGGILAGVSDALTVGLWTMLAAIVGIAGIYVAMSVRRWSRREQSPDSFTLQELREMRARQQISEQEFQALRAEILGRASAETGPNSESAPPAK